MPTSELEMFGMAVVEALACESPVVASDHGGLKERRPNVAARASHPETRGAGQRAPGPARRRCTPRGLCRGRSRARPAISRGREWRPSSILSTGMLPSDVPTTKSERRVADT